MVDEYLGFNYGCISEDRERSCWESVDVQVNMNPRISAKLEETFLAWRGQYWQN